MNDKSNLSPTRRLFASESFRRHYVSAVENGEQADWQEREQGGNLGRVFVFLLLLHVFLIGAIVLYNIVSDRPSVPVAASMGKAPPVTAEDAVAADPNVVKRSELEEYVVKSGDTIKSISDRTGATVEEIIRLNLLDQNGELYVGRRLQLPLRHEGGAAPAAVAVAEPVTTPQETKVAAAKEVTAKAGKGQPEAFRAAETSPKTKAGEDTPAPTYIKIKPPALAQDSPPAETKAVKAADAPPAGRASGAGSAEKVPVATPVKAPEKPAPAVAAAKEKPAPAAAGARSYEIKNGDTFYGLARKNGINVNALMKANPGVDPGRLKQGMVIKIPAK